MLIKPRCNLYVCESCGNDTLATLEHACPSCGYTHKLSVEGSYFDLGDIAYHSCVGPAQEDGSFNEGIADEYIVPRVMNASDVVKELCKMGLSGVKFEYDKAQGMFFFDLNTGAKSELHFYEDFHIEGRYDHKAQIDSDQDVENIVRDLYWEFDSCIYGRDFYNYEWKEIGVQLGILEKKVITTTTVEYK